MSNDPVWSTNGDRIAFSSNRDSFWPDVYVMNSDGSNVIRLTTDPNGDYPHAWSPNGKQIAFTSYRDFNAEIYVMKDDGTEINNITNNSSTDDYPAWGK